jgi:L-glutamine:2-deoxy-scyllo-inosose/3-amino-2,3-dideoxy-scyllo-inosose aminotransferase
MPKLAIKGGVPVRDAKKDPWPSWPIWSQREKERLLKTLDSGIWSYNGPQEQAFNRAFAAFIGARHALSVANGTVSLQLALEALDIGPGDEVIVPGLTWQATAAAVIDVNAVPVLADVDPETWCLSPASLESALTFRTAAVIPVHLYGCVADMDAIMKIARRRKRREKRLKERAKGADRARS